eukprot:GHVU01169283.1.p1 GENE.GHVU01169283.1~~GHVU01169283.1.p1  ORF type:complete len:125 (-),score=12.85 GHVU01169283.1:183-557(-)
MDNVDNDDARETEPLVFTEPEDKASIAQEDVWAVIGSYFKECSLVHQQIQSFNDFVLYKLQEIVDEHPDIVITPVPQYRPEVRVETNIRYVLKFGQLRLFKPEVEEMEGPRSLYPHQCRLRNMT